MFVTSAPGRYANRRAFIAASQRTAGNLSLGTAGQDAAQHTSGELRAIFSGARMVAVAGRGSGPSMTDVRSGRLPAATGLLPAARTQAEGFLRLSETLQRVLAQPGVQG